MNGVNTVRGLKLKAFVVASFHTIHIGIIHNAYIRSMVDFPYITARHLSV